MASDDDSSGCMAKIGGTLVLVIVMGFVRIGLRSAANSMVEKPVYHFNIPAKVDPPPTFNPPTTLNSNTEKIAPARNENEAMDRYLTFRSSLIIGKTGAFLSSKPNYEFEPELTA